MTKWPVLGLVLLSLGALPLADAREVELKIHSVTVAPFAVDNDFWNDDFEIDIDVGSRTFHSTFLELGRITVPGNPTNKNVTHRLNEVYRFDTEELTPDEIRSVPEIIAVERGLPVQLIDSGAASCFWEILFDETKSCGTFRIGNADLGINAELNPL